MLETCFTDAHPAHTQRVDLGLAAWLQKPMLPTLYCLQLMRTWRDIALAAAEHRKTAVTGARQQVAAVVRERQLRNRQRVRRQPPPARPALRAPSTFNVIHSRMFEASFNV